MIECKPYRRDIIEKITGRAKYSADFQMGGMLFAKVLWPKYPVAKIKKIDITDAEKIAGVEKIITRDDVTGLNRAAVFEPYDRPVLVGEGEMVKFIADALAIVIAKSEAIAIEAMEKIIVDYEPVDGIFSLEEAMKNQDPAYTAKIEKGHIEKGFEEASLVIEDEYFFPYIEHAYIEPEAGFAYTDNQGVINVCFGSQNLARHHRMVCKSLGLSYNKVRLSSPYIGGAFGGKHSYSVQVYLALIVSIIKKPVRMVWTREESMIYSSKRHQLKYKIKVGFTEEGKILALDSVIWSIAGPYMGYTDKTLNFSLRYILGTYWIEHVNVLGEIYHTNNIEIGAFRGFGATESTFVIETLMDRAARKLNLTPKRIRELNWLREDQVSKNFPNTPWLLMSDHVTLDETLNKVLDAAGPKPVAKAGKKIGRGIAIGIPCFDFGNVPGYKGTGIDVTLFTDKTMNVRIGFPEVGQGVTGVVTTLISQSFYNIPEEDISIIYSDNYTTPLAGSLGFSRATVNIGNAVLSATKKLIEIIEKEAGKCIKTDQKVKFNGEHFYIGEELVLKFEDFMDYCYYQGVNLTVTGWHEGPYEGEKHGITFTSGLVDLEIDEETGEVKIIQAINCHDCGKVVHEISARGQLLGGTVMGLGASQLEEFKLENGIPKNTSFSDYLIPTAKDIPEKNVALFVECPGKHCPMGAKGLGEHALYTAGPAFANAVFDALDLEITAIPVTPEKILTALNKI